jgi:hypothetical protein
MQKPLAKIALYSDGKLQTDGKLRRSAERQIYAVGSSQEACHEGQTRRVVFAGEHRGPDRK